MYNTEIRSFLGFPQKFTVTFAMKKKILILTVLIMSVLSFAGCGEKEYSETFFAMDTVMTITAYGDGAKEASYKAYKEIVRLEKLLSVTDEESEIYALNHRTTSNVSSETANLITEAVKISNETDGAFDITLYPISLLWGFTGDENRIPKEDEIKTALKYTGYKKIAVNGNNVSLPDKMMLDLGGIAKGYASDRVCEILKENGIKSAVVSLGGNVRTIGKKPNGSLWKVGIASPFGKESEQSIKVGESAVVTSGGYQRNFTVDGKTYHHIIDPKNGYPAESEIASVTVITKNGAEADALSTAFFVMGAEKTKEYCKNHSGISAVIIMQDGEILKC